MTNLPFIGITVSQVLNRNNLVNQNPSTYAQAIKLAGGLPVLIPNEFPHDQIPELFERIDGLLLSGGGDIGLHYFNGEPHPTVAGVSAERDELEITLCNFAIRARKPVLGICRGMQVINVALGGSLYTHIPDQYPSNVKHQTLDENGRDFLAHEITLEPGSKLQRIYGCSQFQVNSFHHQAIKKTAPDLVVTGHASDGLIEAVEMAGDAFSVIGVQWHPECLLEHETQRKLFEAFVGACLTREQS